MNTLLKFFILVALMGASAIAKAHQPDLSTALLVEQNEGKWVLQIRSSLTAFEYEIENAFGKKAYQTPEEFMALVKTHLKKNIAIELDNSQAVTLQNGQVKLGHETSVTFEISQMPNKFHALSFRNSSFKNISRNQSAFMVFKKDFSKDQFILNNDNQHTVDLMINGNRFETVQPPAIPRAYYFFGLIGILLLYSLFYLSLKKKYFELETNH